MKTKSRSYPLPAILLAVALLGSFGLVSRSVGQSTVNWNDIHQSIDGFGASSAWVAQNITDAQADMFFSVTNGIGLSLLRNRITPDGTTWELATMQKAQARGAKVWSTPWSPPAAWKSNNDVNNGGTMMTSYYPSYANQLATYVKNMMTSGVNLEAVSIQNEPDLITSYESCVWSGQQLHDFVPYLASALASIGVSSTKILLAEQSSWSFNLTTNTMNDAATAGSVGIVAAHGYGGTIAPVTTQGKRLWETEVSSFDTFDGSIDNGLTWALKIHQYLTVAEVNAWHYWWLISGNADNEGLTDQSGNPAKRMYVLGNFSKFIRPGYYRMGATADPRLAVSAYRDFTSGNFAIVAVNTNATAVSSTFNTSGFSPATVTPWITSGTLSLVPQAAVATASNSFAYALPAKSVVTFVGQFTGPTAYRVNSGGSAAGLFTADGSYAGGKTYSSTNSIDTSATINPAPQTVYQTQRYGNFTYTFPGLNPGATYNVRLHFAEIYWTAAGRRVFNVAINGSPVLSNFDIFSAAGAAYKATIREFFVPANTNGQIVVQYTTVTDNAASSGIEVLPTMPDMPTGLTAVAASACRVNLTWTDNSSNEDQFEVWYSTDANTYTLLGTTASNVTTFAHTGAAAATTYYYAVRACNSGGCSADSSIASATTLPPPAAPQSLTVTAVSSNRIDLAWTDAATTESGFQIERSTDGMNFTLIATVAANVTSYSNVGLTTGTTYSYRVRATDVCGNVSNASNVAATTTLTSPPAAPTGLTATKLTQRGKINLKWTASTGATSYNVKRATTNGGPYATIKTGNTSTSYTDSGLTSGRTYYYVVSASNAGGESPNSNQASATAK